ncbi:phosphoribosylglycinamide formyltransferase, partial [Pseudomonas syringae pv. pisi]
MPDITVLISGSGSNLQALIDAEASGVLKGKITQVISSSETAYGLERAQKAGIVCKTHTLKSYYKGTTKEQ